MRQLPGQPSASSKFSRGDLLAEYFNTQIFDGHTFADMQQQRPSIMLNATDMGIGSQFSFVQDALIAGVDANPAVYAAAQDVLSDAAVDKRPYIHLLDSGVSDNIGIRWNLTST